MTALIYRTKVYQSGSRPGFAWKYVYNVSVDGGPRTHGTDRLDSIKSIIKRLYPDAAIEFDWIDNA